MPKKYPREIRNYDEDFKRQAVKLYHKAGKSFSEIGEELGVPASTLAGWVYSKKYEMMLSSDEPEAEGLQKELRRLKQELMVVTEEREILKKALAIFSVAEPKR